VPAAATDAAEEFFAFGSGFEVFMLLTVDNQKL
jgi:hypothetical protein